jgi:YbbR domain-containing protein
MSAEASLRQRLRRAFTENLGLKLFSIAVSIGLFTAVHGAASGQRSFQVPVVAILPPAAKGKVLVGKLPDKVTVKLSGSPSVINAVRSLDAVQIDLSAAPEFYTIDPAVFGLPAGLDVEVTPASLTLDWESRLERKLPVHVQFSGNNGPNELVGSPVVTPARLTVSGPRSGVEQLQELTTEPVSLSELAPGPHRRRVRLLPLPDNVSLLESPEITIELTVDTRKEHRRLRRLEVAVLGASSAVSVRPDHVDVIVAAPQRTLDELDPEHVVPVVELDGGVSPGAGAISLPISVRGLPDGARLLRAEPSEVLVRAR